MILRPIFGRSMAYIIKRACSSNSIKLYRWNRTNKSQLSAYDACLYCYRTRFTKMEYFYINQLIVFICIFDRKQAWLRVYATLIIDLITRNNAITWNNWCAILKSFGNNWRYILYLFFQYEKKYFLMLHKKREI